MVFHVLAFSFHIHEQVFHVLTSGLALPKASPSLAVFAVVAFLKEMPLAIARGLMRLGQLLPSF